MYFTRVRGNVKGGCDVVLGPLTLLTGNNGAGKSRVVNTLELAASAEASDIVGRPHVKRGLDLLAMAPADEPLQAYAETDEGKECSLVIERAGEGKGKAPQHTPLYQIKVEYPIRAALEALRGDVRKAQMFVLKNAGLVVSDKAVKKRIEGELHGLYDTFALAHDEKEAGIERLEAIRDDAASTAKASKAGMTKAQKLIDSLASDLPLEEPSEEEIGALTGVVREANAAYTAAMAVPVPVDAAAMRAEAVNAIEAFKATDQRLQAAQKIAEQKADPAAQLRMSMIPLLTVYAGQGGGACVLCETGHVHGTTEEINGRIVKIQSKVQVEQQRAAALAQVQSLTGLLTRQKAAASAAVKAVQEQEGKAVEDPKVRQEAIATAYSALREAEDNLRAVTQNQAQWKTIAEARNRARDSKKEAEQAEELVEACNTVLKSLTVRGRKAFIANVQKYLPPTDHFDLVLTEGTRNVCQFGFRVGANLHTALSGAEWARLTIALGAACMTGGDDVIAVLTPEERAFDPDTLRSVMEALVNAPGQVILTSPIGPSAEVNGWTHHHVE